MKTIVLTKGKSAKVDDNDYENLNIRKWHCTSHGYAAARIGGKIVYMHQLVKSGDGVVDHINGDKLDNRKDNLRVCTQRQNCCNSKIPTNSTTGYKGVVFAKWARLFRAHIISGGKSFSLGYFKTAKEAAIRYNEAATELFGEYAKLNEV